MKGIIIQERRNENIRAYNTLWKSILNCGVSGLGDAVLGGMPASEWCAEITGPDAVYKLARNFLRGKVDYKMSNSVGSRGVFVEYVLDEGKTYEVKAYKERYFCTVTPKGDVVKIPENEVLEWVSKDSE